MVYSTRRFVLYLSVCHFVLVFFSPFSIAITSLGEKRANLSAFRTFVRFVLVWICRFLLPLLVWEGLRFVIVALPGLFSYLFSVEYNVSPAVWHTGGPVIIRYFIGFIQGLHPDAAKCAPLEIRYSITEYHIKMILTFRWAICFIFRVLSLWDTWTFCYWRVSIFIL